MKLKKNSKETGRVTGDGAVCLTIYKKNGKQKAFTFQGNKLSTGKTVYAITKNNPLEQLYEIFSVPDAPGLQSLAVAKYPKMAQYPDETSQSFDSDYDAWNEQRRERWNAAELLDDGIVDFYKTSSKEFLSGTDGKNLAYSPVNVYMALAMLAESADGNSRAQILDLLHTNSAETLRTQAKNLWMANYRNDGATTSILANSLWLANGMDFKKETVNTLASRYLASVYQGDTDSKEMTQALQNWINEQTGGLLKEAAGNAKLTKETIMDLISTIYFRGKWDIQFQKENNDMKVFHSADGDQKTEFMNGTNSTGTYYWGDGYGAIQLSFVDGGCMWLMLPDEGKAPESLLADGRYLDMVQAEGEWKDSKRLIIHYSVPKFDISSEIQLKDGLKSLGVTDVFDSGKSDFTPLVEGNQAKGIYVSKARHAARVVIDEEGCTAAAFTEMALAGSGMPPSNEMNFILDRPFLFVIASDTQQPLFIGIVNQP